MKDQALKMLEMMYKVRFFEERAMSLYKQGKLTGALHLYLGEEAVSVGVCTALNKDDYITSTHRGHGHCVSKGVNLKQTIAELLGRETGCSRGRGGSMHLFDTEFGLMGANGIVGAGIPIATGVAYAAKYMKSGKVVACFFGDGASNQGTFHESANMASLWKLPIIFVCENNHYAATTPVCDSTCIENIANRASAYCMPGICVDGNDVTAVYEATKEAAERARAGDGPSLIECKTFRYQGHCMVVHDERLRPEGEDEAWKLKDPIINYEKKLLKSKKFTKKQLDELQNQVLKELDEAVEFAEKSNFPDTQEFINEHERGYWQCVR